LLTFANGIGERIKELQALAAEHSVETADKCVQELNELRREARADKAYGAAVSAVMGKAKILNFTNEQPKPQDWNTAQKYARHRTQAIAVDRLHFAGRCFGAGSH
jgi:hypothetical protein